MVDACVCVCVWMRGWVVAVVVRGCVDGWKLDQELETPAKVDGIGDGGRKEPSRVASRQLNGGGLGRPFGSPGFWSCHEVDQMELAGGLDRCCQLLECVCC